MGEPLVPPCAPSLPAMAWGPFLVEPPIDCFGPTGFGAVSLPPGKARLRRLLVDQTLWGNRGSPMILLPSCRTAVSAVCVCFLAAGLDCGVVVEGGTRDSHQGSQAGDRRQARTCRGRHRLSGSPDRAADGSRQRVDRASPHAPERPLLAPRPAQAGRPPPAAPAVPAEAQRRGLPGPHPGARPEEVGRTNQHQPKPEGGSLSEPRACEADSNLHSPRNVEETMATTTEPRVATVSVTVGDQELTFESGKIAKQADGSVVVRSGDTMVLAAATGRMEAREGADFFPLTVDVEERMYAAGKIPGGFFKREGRPTERAILTARMIDRPIRPLWPKGFRNEVQVICTVLSADMVTPHDILCMNGASAALMLSPLPFMGPVGAVRVTLIDDEFVLNPTLQESEENSDLDLIVVGTREALTMVEAGANEIPEEKILEALDLAHREIVKLCEAQEELRAQTGKPKWVDASVSDEIDSEHGQRLRDRIASDGLREAGSVVEELMDELAPPLSMESTEEDIVRQVQVRSSLQMLLDKARLAAVEAPVREQFESDLRALTEAEQDSKELKSAKRALLFDRIIDGVELPFPVSPPVEGAEPEMQVKDSFTKQAVKRAAEAVYKDLVRRKIAVEKRRPDGRGTDEIRQVTCEVSVSPRTHGSALFTRGQTQIMTLLTLGTAKEGQRIDDLSLEDERRYMHHYNFPPFSVGETGFMRGPKRRDIGHGALAQRALEPIAPSEEEFPYTIRIVSETLESNGSSSMSSVCASTLAMMDAGVPIKAPVGGIAMGLIKEGDDHVILTDIQGAEDHLGDMDFKVAGTREGVTALQMDIKITGVTQEIMRNALS